MSTITLDRLKKGQVAYLDESQNITPSLLEGAAIFGLMLGAKLELVSALDSMLILILGENKVVIDKKLASSIQVEVLEI